MSQALDNFTRGIKHLIQTAIDKAPFDKTYSGRIVETNGSTCTVVVNGKEYPDTPIIGGAIKVIFPQNNSAQRFVLNPKQIFEIGFDWSQASLVNCTYQDIYNAVHANIDVEFKIIDDEQSEYKGILMGKIIDGEYNVLVISPTEICILEILPNDTINVISHNLT